MSTEFRLSYLPTHLKVVDGLAVKYTESEMMYGFTILEEEDDFYQHTNLSNVKIYLDIQNAGPFTCWAIENIAQAYENFYRYRPDANLILLDAGALATAKYCRQQ